MIDAEILLDAFRDQDLLTPLSAGSNLVDLAQAVGLLCDVEGMEVSPDASSIAANIGEAEHIVLILVDGMGINMVESLPHDSFLRLHLRDELRTVFPSSTAVALTSLTTAQWPAVHGVTGWWTHLPDLESAATILQYTARSDDRDLLSRGIDPERSFPVKSIWALMRRHVAVLTPNKLTNSVYSKYFSGGRKTLGYQSIPEGVNKTIEHALSTSEKTFTYLYLPQVDSLAHLHGITRPEVTDALAQVNSEIERLHAAVESRARLIVTADHGFLDTPAPRRYTLRPTRDLQPLLRFPPSGDARVTYFHTWDWARDRVRRHIQRKFGDKFVVIDTEDAIAIGLFGPDYPTDEVAERIGDVMSISTGSAILEYNINRGPGRMLQMNAHHSGLTPDEMRIPLIVA